MKILDFKELEIPEVQIVRFAHFNDERGYFTETYRKSDFKNLPQEKFPYEFVQANETYSKAGTFRGLHFQWNPHMGKLVRCITGHLIDFALDIRLGSPTFGAIVAYEFKPEDNPNADWIWVPPGFAHGTLLLTDSYVEYLCTGEYSQGCEAGITIFDDDIDWSFINSQDVFNKIYWLQSIVHITEKDKDAFTLKQWKDNPNAKEFKL